MKKKNPKYLEEILDNVIIFYKKVLPQLKLDLFNKNGKNINKTSDIRKFNCFNDLWKSGKKL